MYEELMATNTQKNKSLGAVKRASNDSNASSTIECRDDRDDNLCASTSPQPNSSYCQVIEELTSNRKYLEEENTQAQLQIHKLKGEKENLKHENNDLQNEIASRDVLIRRLQAKIDIARKQTLEAQAALQESESAFFSFGNSIGEYGDGDDDDDEDENETPPLNRPPWLPENKKNSEKSVGGGDTLDKIFDWTIWWDSK